MRKTYINPTLTTFVILTGQYICGDNSLPFGGEGGPGVAESKERTEEQNDGKWGDLW